MNKSPLITVLIPVYNRPYVVKTIKSICEQTYNNLEILIVDNASTDNTVEAIRGINDNRIKILINQENRGQTYSLNRGLEEATGKYIARIDSDDIALPDRIKKQAEYLENHSDYVLVGSWVRFISDDDKLGMIVKMPTTDEGLRLMHTVACGMYHPSAMYRRDVIVGNHIRYDPDIHMAEDYDLWVKLMKYGKACNLAEPLVYYRRGNNNDSRNYKDVMGKESAEIRRRVCENLECQDEKKKELLKEISIETKEKKTISECIGIYQFYKDYLNSNIEKASPDYAILKQHFQIKAYGSCFASNPAWYAGCVRKAYLVARNIRNRIAR